MVVRFYIDVAGSEHEHRAVTAAGYISSDAQWAEFRDAWKNVLDAAGADVFHANEFFPRSGRFRHLKPKAERLRHQALARAFAAVAYGCLPQGLAFTIDCDTFDDELGGVIDKMKTPHDRLTPSMLAVAAICNRAAQSYLPPGCGNQGVALIEDGPGVGEIIKYLQQLRHDGEPWTGAFADFAAIPKKQYEVQAADLLAYEAWRESTRVLEDSSRNGDWAAIDRDTFKILTTGPAMLHPEMGTAHARLHFASKEHYQLWAPQMLAFIKANPQYMRPPWWKGWRRRLRKWYHRKRRELNSHFRGRVKRIYFNVRRQFSSRLG